MRRLPRAAPEDIPMRPLRPLSDGTSRGGWLATNDWPPNTPFSSAQNSTDNLLDQTPASTLRSQHGRKPDTLEEDHPKRPEKPREKAKRIDHLIDRKVLIKDEMNSLEKEANLLLVGKDTSAELILDHLCSQWRLPVPSIIFSITGSCKDLRLSPRQIQMFKAGLEKVVCSTRSWVLTSGSMDGVGGLVGRCLEQTVFRRWLGDSDVDFQLIGLNNWACLDQRSRMDQFWKTHPDNQDTCCYHVKSTRGLRKSVQSAATFVTSLNPLYSRTVAVDGGRGPGEKHQELKLRIRLEQLCSSPSLGSAHAITKVGELAVPTILMVVGGDAKVLEHVVASLRHNIPVMVCADSGGVADVIVGALRTMTSGDSPLTEEQEAALRKQMHRVERAESSGGGKPVRFRRQLELLRECVSHRKHITTYFMGAAATAAEPQGGTSDLDSCVLSALLKSKTAKRRDPVQLALDWNRCDEVVRDIIIDEGDINERPNIGKLMTQAILEDKTDFVLLFQELGLSIEKFLTPDKLAELYQFSIRKSPTIHQLLKKVAGNKSEYSVRDVYEICYYFSSCKFQLDEVLDKCTGMFRDPFLELYIWATLSCREEAAAFFWRRCKSAMLGALVGSKLWAANTLVLHRDDESLISRFEQLERHYVQMAHDVMDKAWQLNPERAKDLISYRMKFTEHEKCIMDISWFIEAKHVIGHPCFQIVVEQEWSGGLKCRPSDVLLALFIPPCISRMSLRSGEVEEEGEIDWDEIKSPEDLDDNDKFLSKHTVDASDEEREARDKEKFRSKALTFYRAPITRFILHFMVYIVFLLYYVYFYIWKMSRRKFDYEEIVIGIYIIANFLESVNMLVLPDASSSVMKVKMWAQSEWNIIDFVYLTTGLIAFVIPGVIVTAPDTVDEWGMRKTLLDIRDCLYAIITLLLWIRILRFYHFSMTLGSIWIMIRKMLVETLVFCSVLGLFMIASGLYFKQLLRVPNYKDPYTEGSSWTLFRPFFILNGELFFEALTEGLADIADEPGGKLFTYYTVSVILSLLFGNVMLLNILIAIFSRVYNDVRLVSELEWRTEVYVLLRHYKTKSYLPPPFSIPESLWRLGCHLLLTPDNLKETRSPKMINTMEMFEGYCVGRVLEEKSWVVENNEKTEFIIKTVAEQKAKTQEVTALIKNITPAVIKCYKSYGVDEFMTF